MKNVGRARHIILLGSLCALVLAFLLPRAMERGIQLVYPHEPDPTIPPGYQENRLANSQALSSLRSLGQAHHWDQVITHVDRYCNQSCTVGIQAMRAEALTRLRRDAEAAAAWKKVHTNLGPSFEGPLLLLEGRTTEYKALCQSMVAEVDPNNPNPQSARTAVWVSLLTATPAHPEKLLALARLIDKEREGHRRAGGSLLGLALVRAGHPEEALTILEDVSTLPQLRAVRALALRNQGRLGEALQETRLFRQQLEDSFGTPGRERVELLLFLRELDTPPDRR